MTSPKITVGIDVGGIKKGFHAVVNHAGQYHDHFQSTNPDAVVAWALSQKPSVIAIDAPSMFSQNGRSRKAERDLVNNGMRCFYTPTRDLAKESHFYDWVFNGELIYKKLELPIFMGDKINSPCVIETFPHAIQLSLWALNGQSCHEGSKSSIRRKTLALHAKYETKKLTSIDLIDAALCAVSADYFVNEQFSAYGCSEEGFIVIPNNSI
jgi:predicted nuclease with RNAse H fold